MKSPIFPSRERGSALLASALLIQGQASESDPCVTGVLYNEPEDNHDG